MADERLDIRLLGPVRAYVGARRVDLGPRKQRLVLAILALEVDRVVPVDRLVELAWPIDAPRTAAHAVRVCVSGLRSVLAGRTDAGIDTRGAGYALCVDPQQVDASRFRRLLRRAAGTDDDGSRVVLLDEALALWSGPAMYGTALSGTAPVETQEVLCRGLEESRLAAIEDRLDAELRLGNHGAVVGEVTELARVHPTRERFAGQLMICLYRDGRQTDALDTYLRLHQRLGEEFGVDPGPAVRELQLAILHDDPALQPTGRPGPTPLTGGRTAQMPAQLPPAATGLAAVRTALPVPAQLPCATYGFVGRDDELAFLDTVLAESAKPNLSMPAAVVISAVSGTAGVGKTALAVHWAHRVADRFPDGQLYVNLRGFDPSGSPMDPADAIRAFLDALGVPGRSRSRPTSTRRRPCTAACSPTGGCWSCWTTPATSSRSGRCCPAPPAAWSWSPAATSCRRWWPARVLVR